MALPNCRICARPIHETDAPGVLVHSDEGSLDGIDHDQDGDHTPVPEEGDAEVDLHVWCERETLQMHALYTISHGERCLTRAVPLEPALQALREYLEELNVEGV